MGVIWPAGSGKVVVLAAALGVFFALGSKPAEAMQLSPQQKADMKLHYDKATRAYDVGKYQEAIEEYQKAYEIGGDAAMIYNIAQAYRLSDQLTEAIRFYRRYLQRSPNAPNREIVERRIAELEKVVDERKKAGAPLVPMAPYSAPLPPVTATPGPVAPPPVAPPPVVEMPPPVAPMPAPANHSRAVHAVLGISLLAIGAAAGVGAILEGKTAQDKANKLSDESKQSGAYYFNAAIEENGKTASKWTVVFASVGAAAVIGGGLVLLLMPSATSSEAPPPTTRPLTPSLAPVIGAGFVGAQGGWSF